MRHYPPLHKLGFVRAVSRNDGHELTWLDVVPGFELKRHVLNVKPLLEIMGREKTISCTHGDSITKVSIKGRFALCT